MAEIKKILWKDLKIGDKMPDGSVVTQIHEKHKSDCYKLTVGKRDVFGFRNKEKENSIVVSEDHLFLVDISNIKNNLKKTIFFLLKEEMIPIEEEMYIITDVKLDKETEDKISNFLTIGDNEELEKIKKENNINLLFKDSKIIKSEPKIYNEEKGLIWLNANEINILHKNNLKLIFMDKVLLDCEYVGERLCRCISTDTGKYSTKTINENHGPYNLKGYDFIHHNSVTIRNIIFHCLTHGIKVGLVDLKLTEFTPWKGHENVLGVANSVRETAELLRISRTLMYKRNAELAKAGVVDIADYKPKKPTNKISIFGREYDENEKVIIKDPENLEEGEKEISIKELLEILNS